jgi:hypothetical protein
MIDFYSTSGVGGPGHHVQRTWITTIISFEITTKFVRPIPTHTLSRNCRRKLKLLQKRSEVTHCVIELPNLWFVYRKSTRSNVLTLNICSHVDHMHTNAPWKWAFIHVLYASVHIISTIVSCIETVVCFSGYPVCNTWQTNLSNILHRKA